MIHILIIIFGLFIYTSSFGQNQNTGANFLIGKCTVRSVSAVKSNCGTLRDERQNIVSTTYFEDKLLIKLAYGEDRVRLVPDLKDEEFYFPVKYNIESSNSILITLTGNGNCINVTRVKRSGANYYSENVRQYGSCSEVQKIAFRQGGHAEIYITPTEMK